MDRQSKLIWNPYTKGYFDNPYLHLEACREDNPIHKGIHNSWMFFRHQDVSEMLRSDDFLVSEISEYFKEKEPYIFKNTNACPYLSQGSKLWPMYLNGDIHKKVRVAIGKSFNNLPLEDLINSSIEYTNKKHKNLKEFDLVSYCSHFIFSLVATILGIDKSVGIEKIEQYSNLLARSQDLFISKQVFQEINEWLLWGKDIFPDSPFKKSIETTLSDLNLSEDDVYSIMAISLMAAFETSKDNLSISIYEILKDSELVNFILNSNSGELNVLIEELFRFSSPLQYTIRVNKKALEYNNVNIEANSKLFLCLASANRDPKVFESPNQIIPTRSPNKHVSFGGGAHFCLGATIARQEMRICLKPMINFLRNFKLKRNTDVKWGKQIFMRTAHSIMIEKSE